MGHLHGSSTTPDATLPSPSSVSETGYSREGGRVGGMASPLGAKAQAMGPVLSLELGNISKLTQGGPQGLSHLWTVFSKCSSSLENGKRLENLSWRLWYEDLRGNTKCGSSFFSGDSTPLSDPESQSASDAESDENGWDEESLASTSSATRPDVSSRPRATASSCSSATVVEEPADDRIRASEESATSNSTNLPSQSGEDASPSTSRLVQPTSPSSAKRLSSATPLAASSTSTERKPSTHLSPSPTPSTTLSTLSQSPRSGKAPRRSSEPARRTLQSLTPRPSPEGPTLPPVASDSVVDSRASTSATFAKRRNRRSSHGGAIFTPQGIKTESDLSPDSLQRIIGTVLPVNFKNGPPETVVLTCKGSSPTRASAGPISSAQAEARRSPKGKSVAIPPMQNSEKALLPAEERPAPSIKSDGSFVTDTTALSDLGLDPLFSPKQPPSTQVPAMTESDPLPAIRSVTPHSEGILKPSGSSIKLAARPALLKRHSTATSEKGGALQRTQSAKSVRIVESPTNEDEGDEEGDYEDENVATSEKGRGQKAEEVPRTGSHHAGAKRVGSSSKLYRSHHPARSSSHTHLPHQQKRNGSSSRLASAASKGAHVKRNGSHADLTSTTSPKNPPPPKSTSSLNPLTTRAAQGPSPSASSYPSSASSIPNAKVSPHPPPPSPASPTLLIPSSVILPRQPNPSPADRRFLTNPPMRRPASPPYLPTTVEVEEQTATPARKEPESARVHVQPPSPALEQSSIQQQQRQAAAMQQQPKQPVQPIPAVATQPAHLKKNNKKFFLSSPTTDSDEEAFGSSPAHRVSLASSMPAIDASAEAGPSRMQQKGASETRASAMNGKAAQHGEAEEAVSDDEDDEFEDEEEEEEEGESDWSSETEDSEDERIAAARKEEERQNSMFAKRAPSQVNLQNGLLSKLLHPHDYPRDFANLPLHLRSNRSALELARARPQGMVGLDKTEDQQGPQLTVTGLHASKSTAAISNLGRAGLLRANASGNHLTRLGGKPADIELDSDSSDEEEDDNAQSGGSRQDSANEQSVLAMDKQRNSRASRSSLNLMRQGGSSLALAAPPTASVAAPAVLPIQDAVAAQAAIISTPRTTRRNMLSTELTESLRVNLILERQTRKPVRAGLGGMVSRLTAAAAKQGQAAATQLQRGSERFAEAPQQHQQPPVSDPYTAPMRAPTPPGPPQKAASDPNVNQHEYYSPGFHHTGW